MVATRFGTGGVPRDPASPFETTHNHRVLPDGSFEWLVLATARDRPDSPLHTILVRRKVALGADGVRLHGIRGVKLKEGLYAVATRQRVEDHGLYPKVEQLYRLSLSQPRVATWSAQHALGAAHATCPPDRRMQLRIFSRGGPVSCAATFMRDALIGFAPASGDARVDVHASSPTHSVALRSGDRFAVIMPMLEPPQDAYSLIDFDPV
jgi:hypothetical protein